MMSKELIRHRIAVVMGTRPEAIKLAPLILALRRSRRIQCLVCVTAQHRQMLDQVLEVFEIEPDADLDLMRTNQTLSEFTARALVGLDGWLGAERPDLVLVQGDTTTAFCSALAAFYRHIPVGHVEAGLRTGDLTAPWPEEANRVLTSRLAALHFAPTELNRTNLRRESIPAGAIHVTGNTVIDALYLALRRVRLNPPPLPGLPEALQPGRKARADQSANPRVVLITGHRRESFGDGFEQICRAIAELAAEFPEVHFVYPVHLNPNVREPVLRVLGGARRTLTGGSGKGDGTGAGVPNVHLIEPLSYLSFVALMARSCLVLTDSGGIQEEAPSLGKPVLVMRATTERPEGVRSGTVQVVGTQTKGIVESARRLLVEAREGRTAGRKPNPYGDGKASARIVKICLEFLRRRRRQGGGS